MTVLQDNIIETKQLSKSFGGIRAVETVDLNVRRNTVHALIGPNGAGKTTVFNLLTKFLSPTSGQIIFNGHDITTNKPADIASRGMVRSFQISAIFPRLTVRENLGIALQWTLGSPLRFWRSGHSLRRLDARANELLESVGLEDLSNVMAGELPYGRKRILELATTLALDPQMLLLDEPTSGLGREDIERMTELIRHVATTRTVLMVEHNLAVVAGLSHTITVLARGRVLAEGNYANVSKNPAVIEAYLGRIMHSTANAEAILNVEGLHGWYDASRVLHGVKFEVRQGQVVTLLGRNGAGKTTTLRAIMGILRKRAGSVKFCQAEIIAERSDKIARRGIAICPEERAIFSSLNVEENLLLPPVVRDGGMSVDKIYELFPNLKERRLSPGTRLSGGEQQMLAIARILRTGANLLLLDEPTEGLAPVIVQKIRDVILLLKEHGYTILLVEQNSHFAAQLADRHYIMENGEIVDLIESQDINGASARQKLQKYLSV